LRYVNAASLLLPLHAFMEWWLCTIPISFLLTTEYGKHGSWNSSFSYTKNSSYWHPRITKQLDYKQKFCQNFLTTKKNRTVKLHKNVTCLNGGILRIRQVFPVSCETLYRWVRTNCCFIGDIYVQSARNMFVLCVLKWLSFLLKGEGIAQTM
jgi:hypothetical protein